MKFWNLAKLLSYNKPFNVAILNRGVGKSYATKKLVVNTYLKTGQFSVYIRRYKTELSKIFCENYFSDLLANEKHNIKVVKNEYGAIAYYDDNPFMYFITLSTFYAYKSTPLINVKWIIFDEFLIRENTRQRYLPNEVFTFLEVYGTIARPFTINNELIDPNTRVIMLGNSISSTNPYFNEFNIVIDKKGIIIKDNFAIENNIFDLGTNSFVENIKSTEYGNYAINNEFLDDARFLIKERKGQPIFNLIFENNKITIFKDDNFYYVDNYSRNNRPCFYKNPNDNEQKAFDYNLFKTTFYFRNIKTARSYNNLFYSNENVRRIFNLIVK